MIVVMQRSGAKLLCVAVCATTALLCALNGALALAVVHGVAALVILQARFGLTLREAEVDALFGELRAARMAEEVPPAMITATVTPNLIAVRSAGSPRFLTAITFCDEMATERWRQLSTALRHQKRRAQASMVLTNSQRN